MLLDVLPGVARSLGVTLPQSRGGGWTPPPARGAVVVLVDGLGYDQLQTWSGHAPWLRSQQSRTLRAVSGMPSTTATSMGSFGTGLPPGAHGMLGYEVLDPDTDRLLNELSWEDGPVPERWQPSAPVFELVAAAGVDVVRIGPGFFDGSGLTRAALRGGRFVAAEGLAARVDAALAVVRSSPRSLVYLYWGDVDKVGHVFGPGSWQWGAELEATDRELARLAEGLPGGVSLTVTADHGMLEVPMADRIDLASRPDLTAGVRHVGGEPRFRHLYCEPGAARDVAAAWTSALGGAAQVSLRSERVASGDFGPVAEPMLARVGDVVVAMTAVVAVTDSRRERPELLALLGLHGSSSAAETGIPLLHRAAG